MLRLVGLALLLPACVDTSPDRVKLTGSIDAASVSVSQALLATGLSGSFSLTLERGDLSESAATIDVAPVVSLLVDGTDAQVATLDALPDPSLPWSVAPDQSLAVTFTLTDQNVLDQPAADAVCSGSALIVSVLIQPENADAFTVESTPVQPTGCAGSP
jgi:hypothetical protein